MKSLADLKKKLWAITSLYVRLKGKRDHSFCKICVFENRQPPNPIEDACHIVRKTRGLSIYFHESNLFAGCKAHNLGEHYHPGLYREKYIAVFGRERVEFLEYRARTPIKYTREDYLEMIEDMRIKLEDLSK